MKMQAWRYFFFSILLSANYIAASPQDVFHSSSPAGIEEPWNAVPGPNATGNLIFQSVSSLLQHWPNTKYANGHAIVAAYVDPGTVFYHGAWNGSLALDKPDWLATDPEHSYLFCRPNCYLYSFVSTRKLRLVYFDGASASKMSSGTMDSQDVLIWGEVIPDKFYNEEERIIDACKWGKNHGLDGFVRMGINFEIMICNFLDGLQLVSNSTLISHGDPVHLKDRLPRPVNSSLPKAPFPPGGPDIPDGWRGSVRLSASVMLEIIHASSWHYRIPGETRIHVDCSRLVSFFDPALTSLVSARVNRTRRQYRIDGISPGDAKDVRDQLVDIFTRDGEGSGIDWRSLATVISKRYSGRLELLRHFLKPSDVRNITQQAAEIRVQVLIMLTPYMLTDALPPNSTTIPNRSWIAPVANSCSSVFTSWIPINILTRQEIVIKIAFEEVLHEICRVLGDIWVDAFDVESASDETTQSLLQKWSKDIDGLMDWLDWSVWDTCKPACGPEEMCYIPTWPFLSFERRDSNLGAIDMTPRCISLLSPHYSSIPDSTFNIA